MRALRRVLPHTRTGWVVLAIFCLLVLWFVFGVLGAGSGSGGSGPIPH